MVRQQQKERHVVGRPRAYALIPCGIIKRKSVYDLYQKDFRR